MSSIFSRREFLKTFGACAAVLPLSGCVKKNGKPNVIIVY